MTTVRFAPSPTGFLHVGNVRTALFNWLFARKVGGTFILRLDDTDATRSEAHFADAIIEDLGWLGLGHDRLERQSERIARYEAAADRLRDAGLLYACYETAEELELKRKRLLARGRPPVYDRAALALSDEERRRLKAEGRAPHWRFKLSGARVAWADLVRGESSVATASVSDPVLIREDGSFLYMLPSVVDDIEMAVTDVLRGEDHVTNTALQIELAEALGHQPPRFGHHPLLVGADGKGLSKRLGSLSLRGLREEGIEPMTLLSFLAKLGTADPVEPRHDLGRLVEEFDVGRLGRAPARFDEAELRALNARLLHETPFAAVRDRLEALGVTAGEAFWEAVKPNLSTVEEAREWWHVVHGTIDPVIEDRDFAAKAAGLLPPEPWDQSTWKDWTAAVKAETGAKGRALFMPLRLALTGRDHGPELQNLLPLIGAKRAHARLNGESA